MRSTAYFIYDKNLPKAVFEKLEYSFHFHLLVFNRYKLARVMKIKVIIFVIFFLKNWNSKGLLLKVGLVVILRSIFNIFYV